ncbi:acyltransferase family protein [Limnohabitans sp.]|uniref:acyltransferase family protein n=1 Tax=Limnohabitans sp. TaxID=1907725 RepID=UPI0038BAC14F
MNRSFVIDVLKLLAAQLIVLHHLACYGPMADAVRSAWPSWVEYLTLDARLAVQIFLVIGGYLAAQSIMGRRGQHTPFTLIQRRYWRLMPGFVLALCWVTSLVWVLRPLISGDWLVEAPTLHAALAHLTLLQSVLDVPALSLGVWYVAADFQLYVLLVLLAHWLKSDRALSLGVAALCVASMWCFNRLASLDNWAIYFFGAYGLGVLAAWARRSSFDQLVLGAVLLLGEESLWFEPRIRLALALLTCLVLAYVSIHKPRLDRIPLGRVSTLWVDSAYAMFLTHFGMIVAFNAAWEQGPWTSPMAALWLSGLAWLASMATGVAFHVWVEKPITAWVNQTRPTWQAHSLHTALRSVCATVVSGLAAWAPDRSSRTKF